MDRRFRALFFFWHDTQGDALGWHEMPRWGWRPRRMSLEAFFEKFDLFAVTPDAVAKMQTLSANGASHASLGQRPR